MRRKRLIRPTKSRYIRLVIPLHRAVSQTLLTRPPLVSKAASCFLLPFDCYPPPSGSFPDITHPSATRQQSSKLLSVTVRL
ncbi:hypothetical protein SK436_23620, partial [Escherichia coli]|uniref:hypothetical protein n=1 Tax=Escherichia coli TaxID=562 RepID=UPI0029F517F6